MGALKPVGTGQVLATTNGSATASSAFNQQSDRIRVVAESVGCHVAVGANPTATTADIYVSTGDPEEISLGPVAAQRVVGVTTGATTTIDFPEGTGCPFSVGDAVSLTATGQSYYDFSHKTIASINNTAGVGGFFGTRIVVSNNSAGIVTAFAAPYAELRRSMKVSVISNASTGKAFIQQVQNT